MYASSFPDILLYEDDILTVYYLLIFFSQCPKLTLACGMKCQFTDVHLLTADVILGQN